MKTKEYGPNERPALDLTEKARTEIKAARRIRGFVLTSSGVNELRMADKEGVK